MIGFEIAQLTLAQAIQRLGELQESAVLPIDEEGLVIEDDVLAHDSAREMRLLLQRILDLDASVFLREMRRLFFHLFAVDHDHYRDLLLQAARRDPAGARDFSLDFLLSEEVLFVDDQYTLHDLIDVLEALGLEFIDHEQRSQLVSILFEPFFRLPSIHARLAKFLAPVLATEGLLAVRALFEMDWIPSKELTWNDFVTVLGDRDFSPSLLSPPAPCPFPRALDNADFEDLRWMAGIETTPTALRFRLLGSLVAAGPDFVKLFLEASEAQPETAFQRGNFETEGQRQAFLLGLDALRRDVIRDAHLSLDWFTQLPEERQWTWAPETPKDPWPRRLRELPMHWGEFADPTDDSDFAVLSVEEFRALDALADRLTLLIQRHPLPSADRLDEGDLILREFQASWTRLLPRVLKSLDILP